jgi:glutamate formiminotransferase
VAQHLIAKPLIECVPNFSEGRDANTIQAIEQAIRSVSGLMLLRSEMEPDHNRSVITFAGPPEAVSEGALRGIAAAVERIDLRRHHGVHPRIGAADVVPFVPLDGATLEDCAALARRTGQAVWKQLGIPVYFYEAAALSPERVPLENVRRGGFEHPALTPDLGGPALHPTAGACAIGARKLLVAFNVNLATTDLTIAKAIARKIRASSGGLPFVKAMGVPLASRNQVQVSMNLTDFEQTPLLRVFEAVSQEAAARGVSISNTQIVGLIPRKAAEGCDFIQPDLILENQLEQFPPEPRA